MKVCVMLLLSRRQRSLHLASRRAAPKANVRLILFGVRCRGANSGLQALTFRDTSGSKYDFEAAHRTASLWTLMMRYSLTRMLAI